MTLRPTYANVMSTVAVFIAMGGTSYAVASLPKGSVGEPQLRKSAVTGEKVKDGSLTGADLAAGTLQSGPRGPRGADGAAGPVGPAGAAGQTGATGAAGPSEVISIARPNDVAMNTAANSITPLVSLDLKPGNWSLDAQVRVDKTSPDTDWVDCDLQPSTGGYLVRATARIGNDVTANTLPLVAATTFTVATRVTLQCRHTNAFSGSLTASNVVLRATRVGSLEQR